MKLCKVAGCPSPGYHKDYCKKHYSRAIRLGELAGSIEYRCIKCDKKCYTPYPSDPPRKFCSHSCYAAYRHPAYKGRKLVVSCSWCGALFKRHASRLYKHNTLENFCGKSCSAQFNNAAKKYALL